MSTSAPERTQLGARPVASWIVAVRPGDSSAVARVDRDGDGAPDVASSDSCTAALDGLLYNAAELRREFPPARADESEAELVLRLYLLLGERLAERLNGRFALVIWDGR